MSKYHANEQGNFTYLNIYRGEKLFNQTFEGENHPISTAEPFQFGSL